MNPEYEAEAKTVRRGNRLGFRIFDFYLSLGIRHAYGLLYIVALHYLIWDRRAKTSMRGYLDARFGKSPWLLRQWLLYRLFVRLGKDLLDLRQFQRQPKSLCLSTDNADLRRIAADCGALVLTAHIGNWQVLMSQMPKLGLPVNIVMRPVDNPAVTEYLRIGDDDASRINFIDPRDGSEAAIAAIAALNRGEIVSIMGDRPVTEAHFIEVPLLGRPVRLPAGPFVIAAVSDKPVIVVLARREGPLHHHMQFFELTPPDPKLGRRERRLAWACKYADCLSFFLRENPFAWANFHDIWIPHLRSQRD